MCLTAQQAARKGCIKLKTDIKDPLGVRAKYISESFVSVNMLSRVF